MNEIALLLRSLAFVEEAETMGKTWDQIEQAYEARCESEREGAPRWCGACRHYHELADDGVCPYVDDMMGDDDGD